MKRFVMSVAVLAVSAMVVGDILAQRRGDGGRRGPGRERGNRGEGRRGGPDGPRRQPPKPGQVLPDFLQQHLQLSADQKKKLRTLQKEVDAKLGKILTDAQRKQLKEMSERRGRFGRRGRGGREGGAEGRGRQGGRGGRGGFGPRGGGRGPGGRGAGGRGGRAFGGPEAMIKRIMSFDKNKDGKLSKDELPRPLQRMFDRADTNKDKVLDKAELKKLFKSRRSRDGGRGAGRPGDRGRRGAGRRGGRGKRPGNGNDGERRRPRRPDSQD